MVTDNASNNIAVSRLLARRCSVIFWIFCGAYTINHMLKDIALIKPIWSSIFISREVTVFIYGHTHVLDWMRGYTKCDIIRPGITKFATTFLSLLSFKGKKKGLKIIVNSTHWGENLVQSRTIVVNKVHIF